MGGPGRLDVCIDCGRETLMHAHDRCGTCYRKYFTKYIQKKKKCKRCSRMMKLHGKGLCMRCYTRTYFYDNLLEQTAKRKFNLTRAEYLEKTHGCEVCGFTKVVDLHHADNNKNNNKPGNLIALCPNHHMMVHRNVETLEQVLSRKKRI